MDVPLPPVAIRQGGGQQRFDDGYFLDSAAESVRTLTALGLRDGMRVVDFGCGPGRVAIGLIRSGWTGSYLGVEVKTRHVRWATRHLTRRWPDYEFVEVDAPNTRYNPDGTSQRVLPVDDGTVDIFCAFSVFSHMLADDTAAYLAEIRRSLGPDGRAYVTAFVEDGVPDVTENPDWVDREWTGPLHGVVYSTAFLSALIEAAGLTLYRLDQRRRHAQTGFVLGILD